MVIRTFFFTHITLSSRRQLCAKRDPFGPWFLLLGKVEYGKWSPGFSSHVRCCPRAHFFLFSQRILRWMVGPRGLDILRTQQSGVRIHQRILLTVHWTPSGIPPMSSFGQRTYESPQLDYENSQCSLHITHPLCPDSCVHPYRQQGQAFLMACKHVQKAISTFWD